MITAGATSNALFGTKSVTAGRWVMSGLRPITLLEGTLSRVTFSRSQSARLVASSGATNFVAAGLAYEVGALGGSLVSAAPGPGGSESVRDWLADTMMDVFGPELSLPELQCGW